MTTNCNRRPSLSGYELTETLYQGSKTEVYRAIKLVDRQAVVIKLLRQEYPTFSELLHFCNQYTIAKNLQIPGIIRLESLEPYRNSYALVMEDFGGISLRQYSQTHALELAEILTIAIELVQILHNLHANRVIHKDIKPDNILIHPDTKEIKLIDFSIASLLPKETPEIKNPNRLEGTLGYLAPEQTGRMNRGIDYRSDLYALGVTLFELLAGQLPFESDDPIELVHSHIAKQPPSLTQFNIPEAIANIATKLMAKNAEDRYQSAMGLKHDLEKCWLQWKEIGEIEPFELGKRDIGDRFIIPEKLYGRDIEVQTLLDAFDRVACVHENPVAYNPQPEMMLVTGLSGIGKTVVVNEVHKPIVRQRGYFIKGKFDQFNRNIPFSAFLQALRDLMGQILSESDAQLQSWKTQLLNALGENGQVIIDVIPELELIIRQQPAATELSGTAAQNRFNLLFQKFIQVFATQEHPLVIFLDDLQWADFASLKLMQLLIGESQTGYLMLIGAYRDNEVFTAHPLILMLDEVRKTGVTVNAIALKPLSELSLNQLVADTLSCAANLARPLTELVYQKTKGNPFFATQFLKALHQDGSLAFNQKAGHWQCDITQVREAALTDDVVKFMAAQLQKLHSDSQEILKWAACIGNQFDLNTLAIVSERSLLDAAAALWKALQEALILPQSEVYKFYLSHDEVNANTANIENATYRFLHDRVQQAAYSLIPEGSKKLTHLKIGQMLLQNAGEIEREEKLFDIVNHFNRGIDLITEPTDKYQLARLNLVAGHKAKASTAYATAVEYLNLGLQLLAVDSWQHQYDLTLKLYTEAIEAEYLNTNFEGATALATIVLQRANCLLDRVRIYELQMQMYVAKLELLKTIEIGRQVLEMLEIDLEKPIPVNLEIEDLAKLPDMTDPQKLAAMRILTNLISAAYFADPDLLFPIILTMIHLSRSYGNCFYSAYGYVLYGLLLCGPLADIPSGYRYGQLALQLLDRFNAKQLKAKILLVYNGNIRHWKEHTKTTIEPLLEAIQVGVETGDIEYAGYATTNYCDQRMAIGDGLELMEKQRRQYIDLMQKFKQEYSIEYHKMGLQMTLNLLGKSEDECQLIGEAFDEKKMLPLLWSAKTATLLFYFHWLKGRLLYLFESAREAVNLLKIAEEYIDSVAGMVTVGEHNFYYSLALLAVLNSLDPEIEDENDSLGDSVPTRTNYFDLVIANQEKLKEWANLAPFNYQHKYNLVEAEKAKLCKENWQAAEFYDRAIAGAKDNGYIQEEALANELAAKFYLGWGKEKFAAGCMQEAYYCYARWGAKAKIAHLEHNYPQLLTSILQPPNLAVASATTITSTSSIKGGTNVNSNQTLWLDFPAVMKAAQAISQEIELEKLLTTLMQIAIANAGAEIGHLILHQNGQWLAIAQADRESAQLLEIPIDRYQEIPKNLIYAVARNQTMAVFDNLSDGKQFAHDCYIATHQPKSVLCTPISRQGKLIGILYLENNLTVGAFTSDRIEILQLLTSQAAISIENARLYQKVEGYSYSLEVEVERKTQTLNQKAQDLEQALKQLQQTQAQLIQTEKMSSLGQLVAGMAHEINNPVTFINGNIIHIENYIKNLISLLKLYQQEIPKPSPAIQIKSKEIELDFLLEDVTKILSSMTTGSDRISQIIWSLRNFARLDESSIKAVDLQRGIESTLLILQNRLQSSKDRPEIRVVKEYGDLPRVTCYPGQLNQVFLNIINNAIDAIRDNPESSEHPEIRIRTEVIDSERLRVAIANTDSTIPESIQNRIFEPFFTTKPVGSGTGLGLFVSYSIIQKHGGTLTARSHPTAGTKFEIILPCTVY